jgi:hypothetical protein
MQPVEEPHFTSLTPTRSLLRALGLRASSPGLEPTNYAAGYVIFNFISAFLALSSRGIKVANGIDNNASPRQDLAVFGERAVAEGKMTRATLKKIQRWEAAHANAVEHFPFFFGSSESRLKSVRLIVLQMH